MDRRVSTALILQGWLLAIQTALWSVLSLGASGIDNPYLAVYSALIAVTTAVAALGHKVWLLAYCFLAAATMWAGSSVALWTTGHDIPAVFFALCLASIHSSCFIRLGCWRAR